MIDFWLRWHLPILDWCIRCNLIKTAIGARYAFLSHDGCQLALQRESRLAPQTLQQAVVARVLPV